MRDFMRRAVMCGLLVGLASAVHAADHITLGGAEGQHIFVGASSDYGTAQITVEAEVRLDSAAAYNIITARGPKAPGHWELYSTPGDGYLSLHAPDLAPVVLTTAVSITDGAWHTVGWTWDGSTASLWVDGVAELTASLTGTLAPGSYELKIGTLVEGGLGCEGAFRALRISDVVRDLTGQGEPTTADANTVSLWRAADLAGSEIPDQGAAGRPAYVSRGGTHTVTPDSSIQIGGPARRRLYIEPDAGYRSLPLTVEAWVRLEPSTTYQIIAAHGPKTSGHWELYTTPNNGNFSVYVPDLSPPDLQSGVSITDGLWHHVGWTCGAGEAKLYVDGVLLATVPVTGSLAAGDTAVMVGELLDGTLTAQGDLAALRISSVVRELTGAAPPFVADGDTVSLWRAEDLTDGVISDQGLAGNPAWLLSYDHTHVFDEMLDETEAAMQLALPLTGSPELDAEVALPATPVASQPGAAAGTAPPRTTLSLDGEWRLTNATPGTGVGAGYHTTGLDRSAWHTVQVPSTVQRALLDLGEIDDPLFGTNSAQSLEEDEWWFVREFTVPAGWSGANLRLYFDGVDYTADFYLNGTHIGYHRGMYGGPELDVSSAIVADGSTPNTLAVKIDPPPASWYGHPKPSVVFGWHYGHMISMGLWRGVQLQVVPDVEVLNARVTTPRLDGQVGVELLLDSHLGTATDTHLVFEVAPDNFTGAAETFDLTLSVPVGKSRVATTVTLSDPQAWWPMGYGAQNLYGLTVHAEPASGSGESISTTFGIRSLEMRASPAASPAQYRWQFRVNGVDMFIKGANWCFFDPFLENDPAKYEHILELTRRAGVQMLRVWGGGPIEDDVMYDLCNRRGIMIWQEFPYCFQIPDIPTTEHDVMDDQAARVVRRLRNHPCLMAWGGGNEVQPVQPENNALHYLGKRIRQLDPSRPYHLTSPWGGDLHNWNIFHNGVPIEGYADGPTVFLTEYGLPCATNWSSMQRYLPASSIDHWPPTHADTAVILHSNQFSLGDFGKVLTYAGDYGPVESWDDYIRYGQMAQADAFRYGAEFIRAGGYRGTTGYFFYKMTDIFPGQAWSIVDYYGVPKLSYWRIARMTRPLHAFATYDTFDFAEGETFEARIHLANDLATTRSDLIVRSTVYGGSGAVIHTREQTGLTARPASVAGLIPTTFTVPADCAPMLLCIELEDAGAAISDAWYWFNHADITTAVENARAIPHWGYPADQMPSVFRAYADLPASRLDDLYPETTLSISGWTSENATRWRATVTNQGAVPAVFVTLEGLPDEYGYYMSDNAFMLRPGASRVVTVDVPDGAPAPPLTVTGWNVGAVETRTGLQHAEVWD